ncbi:MAG: hypothetical protein K9N06_13525 [Candidatus Cloacimonetes bacterium]|nr:hypothetical protein [Candidatus Cloacimonadota bacterium]
MVSLLNKIEDKIRSTFIDNDTIRREELYHLLEEYFYPDLKDSTFDWRIYELKKSGVIVPVKQGLYKLSQGEKIYIPLISNKQKRINRLVNNNINGISYCSWNSNWLNDFSRHQAFSNIVLLNVEKEFMQTVFHLLIDNSFQNVYLDPDQKVVDTYISENKDSIVIIPLVSKSPVYKIARVPVPQLEKILVDIFCDNKILYTYKGEELATIFRNAFDEYRIDISRLINYSRRRKKENQIKIFLIQNHILEKELFA